LTGALVLAGCNDPNSSGGGDEEPPPSNRVFISTTDNGDVATVASVGDTLYAAYEENGCNAAVKIGILCAKNRKSVTPNFAPKIGIYPYFKPPSKPVKAGYGKPPQPAFFYSPLTSSFLFRLSSLTEIG
jgi:hypothetical protein